MESRVTRRSFLAWSAVGCASLAAGRAFAQDAGKRALKGAVIIGKPTLENLKPIKDAGFEGVEAGVVSPAEAVEARKVAEGLGLRIHSVMPPGWGRLNADKPEEVEASITTFTNALRAGQGYGADAVLVVPGRIDARPMPEAWEFRVKFDAGTGDVKAVAAEGNDRYQAYMETHNRARDAFRKGIDRLIPVAEETRVVLAIENVWNNLFVDPEHFAHFIDSFRSPWVQAYLDLGNHVKYSPPERWVAVLGKRIAKCHVKDFRLNADGHGGQFVDIGDGSVDWPVVRKALAGAGYEGWATIEGSGGLSLEERRARLSRLLPPA